MRKTLLLCLVTAVACGCTTSWYEASADREVYPIMAEMEKIVDSERVSETPPGVIQIKPEGAQIDGGRLEAFSFSREFDSAWGLVCGEGYRCLAVPLAAAADVLQSTMLPPVPATLADAVLPAWRAAHARTPMAPRTRYMNLEEALVLAFTNSRDFKSAKESLYLSVLSYTRTRHSFVWNADGSVSSSLSISGNGSAATSTSAGANASFSLARRLLTGGSFSVSTSVAQSGTVDGPGGDSNSSSVSTRFSHSLLAGAGSIAEEPMVQAELSLLSSARGFELFRQGLAIGTISQYYNLLKQRRFIESAQEGMENAAFLYEQSKALFGRGEGTKVEELRVKQTMLTAANSVNFAIEDYKLSLDRFKITLGLPTDDPVDITEEPMDPEIVYVNLDGAVRTAMENRLDLKTRKEQLDTSSRSLDHARNRLLPSLEFFAQATASSDSAGKLFDYSQDDTSASMGLSLSGFVDKTDARNAYKRAVISHAQAQRGYTLFVDEINFEVRKTVSRLRSSEISLAISKEQVELAKTKLEAAYIDFDRGIMDNRDVDDALKELQKARDALVESKVSYFLSQIRLRKDIGTLRVNERGAWK